MEEMDIDFDIEEDPIKQFLLHKLEDIKQKNLELEQQISRRKEMLNNCVAKMASEFGENILEVIETWQRILNGKWIVGLKVRNTSGTKVAKNINAVLKWDSAVSLTYSTSQFCLYKPPPKIPIPEKISTFLKICEEKELVGEQAEAKPLIKNRVPLENEWIKTDEVQGNVCLILAFDVPEFVKKSFYKISGFLRYQLEEKSCQLNIPDIEIKVCDLTNSSCSVKAFDVTNGDEQAFLSTRMANKETQLVVRISQNTYASLDRVLEFECGFRKVNIISRTNFFFVTDIADSIDGCLLEVDKEENNMYDLNIFSRDQTTLQLLLHYLHQKIPDILILPKEFKQNVMNETLLDTFLSQDEATNDLALKRKLKEFGKAMDTQMFFVEKFCRERLAEISKDTTTSSDDIDLNVDNYRDFRKELADLELKCDLDFLSVDQLTHNTEIASESSQD